MNDLLTDLRHEFQRQKALTDRAISALDDAEFFRRPGAEVNPVALIVKHLAGNLASRWTDFLTTDGEKAGRDRDGEFQLTEHDTRANLLAAWERGWGLLFATLADLEESDLEASVTIRGEVQSARQALLRGLSHVAYHTGQVAYLARLLRPESPWLTIAPGQSRGYPGDYRREQGP
jgi:uncharacterized damage-inducible protein DinB